MAKTRRKYSVKSFGRSKTKATEPLRLSEAPTKPSGSSLIDSVLWDFQQEAVRLSLRRRGFGLLMPMGSGKTLTALRIIEIRHARQQVFKACLVLPLTITEQWEDVIREWLPHAELINNPRTPETGKLQLFVCHYDWARTKANLNILRKAGFDLILADEGHKLKNRDSSQSRRLGLIAKSVMYRLLLTGSPVESNELDLWAQIRFIDDRVFGEWTSFKDEWTRGAGFMGKKRQLKKHLRGRFLEKVKDVSFLVESKDVLNLPPCVDQVVPLRLTGRQRLGYRQMEDSMSVSFDGWSASADLAVTQLIRLQQLTGGFVTDEEGEYRFLNSVKRDWLSSVIEQHPEPLLIYARFLPEIEQILSVVGKRKVLLHTGEYKVSPEAIKSADIVVAQISTLAGLDGLQHRIATGVFYSKTFSRIEYDQARTRLLRSGQTRSVHFLHARCVSSVDEDLDSALTSKGDVIKGVVSRLKQRIKSR